MNVVGTAAATCASPARGVSIQRESPVASIYEVDPLRDARWEALVNSHPQASVFHCTRWLNALKAAYGYDPIVITSCSQEEALTNGLVFCRIESWLTGRRFVSLPFSDDCEPLVSGSAQLDDLLLYIRAQVEHGRWKYAEIRPAVCQPGSQTGFGPSMAYRSHRLDLSASVQELLQNSHRSCIQRKIRRAEREKLQYEEGTSEALLRKFYELLIVTRRRQFLPPQPLSWFRALAAAFDGSLKIRVASKDDLPVASILTITHRQSMVYKYGCSDARFHNLGGMAWLFWRTIQEAKQCGLEVLEMGRTDISNLGLIAFKEHWGATGTDLNYWTYPNRSGTTEGSWERRVLRKTIPLIPDLALKAMGNFLYRHVG